MKAVNVPHKSKLIPKFSFYLLQLTPNPYKHTNTHTHTFYWPSWRIKREVAHLTPLCCFPGCAMPELKITSLHALQHTHTHTGFLALQLGMNLTNQFGWDDTTAPDTHTQVFLLQSQLDSGICGEFTGSAVRWGDWMQDGCEPHWMRAEGQL